MLIVICVYNVGYKRGHIDAECKRLPFDLGICLQLYDMRTNIPTNVDIRVASEQSIRLLIYAKLAFLEKHGERVEAMQLNRNGFTFNQGLFAKKVERAKQIVAGLDNNAGSLARTIQDEDATSAASSDQDETTVP
ncbi:MAG: hypothetical protein ACOX5G_14305 [Kiritimatiellia bacterium]|jgi:hypothetical protein